MDKKIQKESLFKKFKILQEELQLLLENKNIQGIYSIEEQNVFDNSKMINIESPIDNINQEIFKIKSSIDSLNAKIQKQSMQKLLFAAKKQLENIIHAMRILENKLIDNDDDIQKTKEDLNSQIINALEVYNKNNIDEINNLNKSLTFKIFEVEDILIKFKKSKEQEFEKLQKTRKLVEEFLAKDVVKSDYYANIVRNLNREVARQGNVSISSNKSEIVATNIHLNEILKQSKEFVEDDMQKLRDRLISLIVEAKEYIENKMRPRDKYNAYIERIEWSIRKHNISALHTREEIIQVINEISVEFLNAKKLLINNSLDDVNNSLQKFNKLDSGVKDPDFLGITQQLNEIKEKALQELTNIKNNSSQLATIAEASKYENNVQEVQEKFVKDLIKIFDGNINTDRINWLFHDWNTAPYNRGEVLKETDGLYFEGISSEWNNKFAKNAVKFEQSQYEIDKSKNTVVETKEKKILFKNMTFDEYVSNFNKTMSEVEKRLWFYCDVVWKKILSNFKEYKATTTVRKVGSYSLTQTRIDKDKSIYKEVNDTIKRLEQSGKYASKISEWKTKLDELTLKLPNNSNQLESINKWVEWFGLKDAPEGMFEYFKGVDKTPWLFKSIDLNKKLEEFLTELKQNPEN
ncbi:Lmp protein [Metamycoplasma hominis]|uniref:Lmp protein n=1 Tax=Metamycoplasma hominis TaxID=2098 RepID=UPI003CE772C2